MEGTFKNWVPGKLFGFIKPDDGQPDLFVHKSTVPTGEELTPGARVSFEIEISDKGRLKATSLTIIAPGPPVEQSSGRVRFWNEHGFGFVEQDGGRGDVYVNQAAIRPSLEQNRRSTRPTIQDSRPYLCEGDLVEFSVLRSEKGLQAGDLVVTGWSAPADPWSAFADTGPPGWLESLAELAEKEPWDYKHTKASEPLPILRSYVRYTFRRLTEMDGGVAVSGDGQAAAFNTGLVTPNQEEIYGLFRGNPRTGRQPWKLAGFKKASEWALIDKFGSKLPPLANYFDDPSVLLYDRRCELYINIDHVMEQIGRFPDKVQSNLYQARQLLVSAEATTKKRVYRNYKTAIPQYYRDKGREGSVQLLLPICLEDPGRADLALVVDKTEAGNAYRGSTVLTLDMAYNNARLLSRPDVEWLQP